MARSNKPGTQAIYELHRTWLFDVLPTGDSLLTPGQGIWTADHLAELERDFIGQPLLTKGMSYLAKLQQQLEDSSPEAKQLMAEVHVVYFLMVSTGAISAAKKTSDLNTILSWMPAGPSVPPAIAEAMSPGIAHPGQWALSRRDTQVAFLIRFAATVATHPDLQAVLAEPFQLKALVMDVLAPFADDTASRLSLLHLAHPDFYEPIVQPRHKLRIIERWPADSGSQSEDIDQRLLHARSSLSATYGEGFGWYDDPLVHRWWKSDKKWPAFLRWARFFREEPSFDADERTYKLELAKLLAEARQEVVNDQAGWPDSLKRVFTTSKNNITLFRSHAPFYEWVQRDPAAARSALFALWSVSEPGEALDQFAALVPVDVLSTLGERLNIGSYLRMGTDVASNPPAKISAFRTAWKLTNWGVDADGSSVGEVYSRILALCDELVLASQDWTSPLRDRLDAQGTVWAIAKATGPAGWDHERWAEFDEFRKGMLVVDEDEIVNDQGQEWAPTLPTFTDEPTRRRRRYEVIRETLLNEPSSKDGYERLVTIPPELQARLIEMVNRLAETGDLNQFLADMGDNTMPPGLRKGAHRTFVAEVANKASGDLAQIGRVVASSYRAPSDGPAAAVAIRDLVDSATRIGTSASARGMVPLAVSKFWAYQSPDRWPPLWASAEPAARQLGWLGAASDAADRYGRYAQLAHDLSEDEPAGVPYGLRWLDQGGMAGVDPFAVERCQENAVLASAFFANEHSYPDQESESVAAANVRTMLGDLKYIGAALADEVTDGLNQSVTRVLPNARYGPNLPYRHDAFVGWRPTDSGGGPTLRLWVTVDGVLVGLHPGWGEAGSLPKAAQEIAELVPDGMSFYKVQRRPGVYRFHLAEGTPDGEFLVCRMIPLEEATTSGLETIVADAAAKLRPAMDRLLGEHAVNDLKSSEEISPPTSDYDHLDAAAADLLVERAHLDEVVALLEDKRQVILYGPPGTGKTYLAKRLARALAGDDAERYQIVQFHPATTYEDFIEGLRPRAVAGGVEYVRTPGPLVRMAEKATANPSATFVLVIDEINRANLPKVLGELLFLLEYRDEPAQLLYRPDQPFHLPKNLWLIGTMNTADRSIALIDAAMRRRFHFVPYFPHMGAMKDLLRSWLRAHHRPLHIADLVDRVNEDLRHRLGDHLLIGPSFFMKDDLSVDALRRVWEHNVFPFLEEQLWGDDAEVDRWRWTSVLDRYRAEITGQVAVTESAVDDELEIPDDEE